MRGQTKLTWIKINVNGWLHGSIRWQLEPAERGVWADLIVMAGQCMQGGKICDNDGRGYPKSFIASQLNISEELLIETIDKCKVEGRITDEEEVITITNWAAYQSEYERQKKYRGKGENDKDPNRFIEGPYGHMVNR